MSNLVLKNGTVAGVNYDKDCDVLYNDKRRKYIRDVRRAKAQNLKYFHLLKNEAKKYNISNITVLDCDVWVGDYGKVATDLEITNNILLDYNINTKTKYIWNILRKLQNKHFLKYFKWVKIDTVDNSELYHLFYVPQGYKEIKYGEAEDEIIIVMKNGQCFDVHNSHYYNKKDSSKLRKEIKKGYDYSTPNNFYWDLWLLINVKGVCYVKIS